MGVGPSSAQGVAVFRPPADEAGEFEVEDLLDLLSKAFYRT